MTEMSAADFNRDLPNYKSCPKLLSGQKPLVTGANSGIREAVAIGLARAGPDVVVNYVTNPEAARKVVATIEAEGVKGLALEADVSKEAEVQDMFKKAIDAFGTVFTIASMQKIGTSAVQSRATGGVAQGTYLFALPGSPGACKDAWDGILVQQLDSRHKPCNFLELMRRLEEHLEN